MHIAMIADPYIPIPPKGYGGIERMITFLIEEYMSLGHQVTLFCHPDSLIPCQKFFYGKKPHYGIQIRILELSQIWSYLIKQQKDFDVIHSFGRLAGLLPCYFSTIPKIQSYQREISRRNIWAASLLSGSSLYFTACTRHCWRNKHLLGQWKTIYNGVVLKTYTFKPTVSKDAPLVFLGRIERIKGAHTAIKVALKTKRRLIIAGNHSVNQQEDVYWKKEILPFIGREGIEYIGEINDQQKNDLLGNALAFLMPIEWEEPFGIVMIEAMACGTPVIAFNRGSVSEVVIDQQTGFICQDQQQMIDVVNKAHHIRREECRKLVENKFSSQVIAQQYLALYEEMLLKKRTHV